MITRISKASLDHLNHVADFVLESNVDLREYFPHCHTKQEIASALKKSSDKWNVLITDRPIALFSLTMSDANAILRQFFPEKPDVIDVIVSSLQNDLRKMKIQELTLCIPEELTGSLSRNGFEKRNTLVRLSGRVVETKLLPILQLANPSDNDIPALAKLMDESYAKSMEMELPDASSAERLLRDIMTGSYGTFLADSSFVSGPPGKIVSACFVTCDSPDIANVAQLFTHPLYRARGLATTEIASSMNRLIKRGVSTLAVWLSESNHVAKRLFGKLGFNQDRKVIRMAKPIG